MARGTFNFAANFQVKLQDALDPRLVIQNKSDLINKETWPYDGDTIYAYNGMIVAVAANKAMYMLVDVTKILETDYSGWKQMDVSASQVVEIIDNLDSSSTTAALSANQGKILNEKITTLNSKLSSVYVFKGSATVATLPQEAQSGEVQVGWVYNMTEDFWIDNDGYVYASDPTGATKYPKGTNIALIEATWGTSSFKYDALSGIDAVDLTNYYTKGQTDSAIETAVSEVEGTVSTLQQSVTTNTQDIATIKGSQETTGSLLNILKQAKDYTDTEVSGVNSELANKVDKVDGSSLITSEKLALIDTNASNIQSLTTRVQGAESKLTVLQGGAEQAGSVQHTVNGAITAALSWIEV